jgi:hypothetical protein
LEKKFQNLAKLVEFTQEKHKSFQDFPKLLSPKNTTKDGEYVCQYVYNGCMYLCMYTMGVHVQMPKMDELG